MPQVVYGVIFHWLGGLASGSFYVPYKAVRKWSWEVYWLAGGFFSWIIAPWIMAFLLSDQPLQAIMTIFQNDPAVIGHAYMFGVLWGIGGLTFGLTMRYLGMSLGMAVALGLCTVLGTLLPDVYLGTILDNIKSQPPYCVILLGLGVCLLGVILAGVAGMSKERELPEEVKKESVKEFNFTKGVFIALISGLFSACMAFGLQSAEPIANESQNLTIVKLAKSISDDNVNAQVNKILETKASEEEQASFESKSAKSEAKAAKTAGEKVDANAENVVPEAYSKATALEQVADGCAKMAAASQKEARTAQDKKDFATASQLLAKAHSEHQKAADHYAQAAQAYAESVDQISDASLQHMKAAESHSKAASMHSKAAIEYGKVAISTMESKLAQDVVSKDGDAQTISVLKGFQSEVEARELFVGLPKLCVVLLGGFTTNFLWCLFLMLKNSTLYQFFTTTINDPDKKGEKVKINYAWNLFFSALAGTTWYFQFFFYSMGETRMGEYKFSSWTLHMASIIIFSSIWGLCLREWKGSSRFTKFVLGVAIFTLVYSTIIVGYGNLMKQTNAEEASAVQAVENGATNIIEEAGDVLDNAVETLEAEPAPAN